MLTTTPTTKQMRNSIETFEKTDLARIAKPEELIDLNIRSDKSERPLPRDGFSCVEIDMGWLIFGGDRHKVSYNDSWYLNKHFIK